MAEKTVYMVRLDEIENRVYREILKPLGFRKYGRSIDRVVDGDMVQIVYFEGGNSIRQENDGFWVDFSVRVPEATEMTFTPKPLKKGGYHEADANFRLWNMDQIERKAWAGGGRYPLFEGCEDTYVKRIKMVLEEVVLPIFDDLDNREKFMKNREKYYDLSIGDHLALRDQALILGRLGRMSEAQECFQRFYEEGVAEDRKLIAEGE